MRNDILDAIRRNRISSTEVADALGKQGALPGIVPLNSGHFVAGEVFYVCTWNNSNWPLHEQIQSVPRGSVVYVDTFQCGDRAVFGDLVAKYLLLYQGVRGVIVNGYLRDAHRLRKEDYPLWCKGTNPIGCFNTQPDSGIDVHEYIALQRERMEAAIVVADDTGCTVIEQAEQSNELLEQLEFIELQEDIWYFCIDTLKLSTFETICLKSYMQEPSILPARLWSKLKKCMEPSS